MTGRTYGQFCGLARALELVGERWSLLVVRDLILGPKRFTDLREGLPRIPVSILSARLNELEENGVIRRRVLPKLDAAVVYELTEYGSELEEVLLRLGLWGARSLGDPAAGDAFGLDTAILSLYTTFRPEYAENVRLSFQINYGEFVVHAVVDNGHLRVAEGELPEADLALDLYGSIRGLAAGEITPAQAVESGLVHVNGDPALLDRFVELFHIPAAPVRSEGLAVH
jgi:DNA-binding HxlR family transcriptional regulator